MSKKYYICAIIFVFDSDILKYVDSDILTISNGKQWVVLPEFVKSKFGWILYMGHGKYDCPVYELHPISEPIK